MTAKTGNLLRQDGGETASDSSVADEQMRRIEVLVAKLEERSPSETVELARELVDAVLQVHGAGLTAILDAVRAGAGPGLLERMGRDPCVRPLLALHEIAIEPEPPSAARTPSGLVPVERLRRT